MKKTRFNHVIEYFSLTLILSYFFIHNIYLVLVGITFSLYLININFINRTIGSINKNFFIRKDYNNYIENDKKVSEGKLNLILIDNRKAFKTNKFNPKNLQAALS